MSYNFNDKIEAVDLKAFKILDVTKTEKFTLIKGTIYCPVYFAFYSHFIVCSGDYGEWVFDCTWETNKRNIPESLGYLCGKLSRDCKKMWFDPGQVKEDFLRAKEAFYETYDLEESYGDDVKNAVDTLFEDFEADIYGTDQGRIVGIVDKYAEDICDEMGIDFDTETWNWFYECGEVVNEQLIVNLAMLKKIRELGILINE